MEPRLAVRGCDCEILCNLELCFRAIRRVWLKADRQTKCVAPGSGLLLRWGHPKQSPFCFSQQARLSTLLLNASLCLNAGEEFVHLFVFRFGRLRRPSI